MPTKKSHIEKQEKPALLTIGKHKLSSLAVSLGVAAIVLIGILIITYYPF